MHCLRDGDLPRIAANRGLELRLFQMQTFHSTRHDLFCFFFIVTGSALGTHSKRMTFRL